MFEIRVDGQRNNRWTLDAWIGQADHEHIRALIAPHKTITASQAVAIQGLGGDVVCEHCRCTVVGEEPAAHQWCFTAARPAHESVVQFVSRGR